MRQRCSDDLLYFINTFVFVFEPRESRAKPMATWASQDAALVAIQSAIEGQYDLLIGKSRDQGASWDVLMVYLWFFLFRPQSTFWMMSRLEVLVDNGGDPDSLFWKFRFALNHLPGWLKPTIADRCLHVANVDNGSVLDGGASAPRGGRRLSICVDEHAHIEQPELFEQATADVCQCRIRVSTPRGMNMFGRMLTSGAVKTVRLHWSTHPSKSRGLYRVEAGRAVLLDGYRGPVTTWRIPPGEREAQRQTFQFPEEYPFRLDGSFGPLKSPWYDGECVRRGSEIDVAQELDIDCLRSGHTFFDAAVLVKLIEAARKPIATGTVLWELRPDERIDVRGWSAGASGSLSVWCECGADGRPSQNDAYAAGADISEGMGASNSCLSVYSAYHGRKVGELVMCRCSPERFARECVAVLLWFGGYAGAPYFGWEQNGPGLIFGGEVLRLGYGPVYYARNEEAENPRTRKPRIPGWASNRNSKTILLGEYRRDLARGTFINPGKAGLEECLQYVIGEDGAPVHEGIVEDTSGARAAHGDRVIADGICNLIRQEVGAPPVGEAPFGGTSILTRRQEAAAKRDPDD